MTLKIKSLKDRREELCLKFAKSCLKIEKFKKFFPLNKKDHSMLMRNTEKFSLEKYGSVRYKDSAVPYMKRLLKDISLIKTIFLKYSQIVHFFSLTYCDLSCSVGRTF